jgi:2-polyprenyl-3-methyl-5-hydroxy-6-metoxy-1,4-benzoquinol methylase
MLERIIKLARSSDYDFRSTACPEDPLKDRFEEWIPYYRLKRAIAFTLQPQSILEIGVRYGYSALAFLDACPSARYLGIDLDTDSFGGRQGAIEYARRATGMFRADYLIGDSQLMAEFPGGIYDLIHLDGQQDEAGWWHDLKLALNQARYILVDGYFWTDESFLAISGFLRRYRDQIEGYTVIPGYAGELLIRPRPERASFTRSANSLALKDAYTESYFLKDCGGYDSFRQTHGTAVLDTRLLAVLDLCSIVAPGRALDLGCGRGELTVALTKMGHEVTAIDYSESAVALARSALTAAAIPESRVDLRCQGLNEAPLNGFYDLAVCADVVEHLSSSELEELYSRLAAHLKPEGVFVLHTYPNSWYYRYDYGRRRRLAATIGAYLPLEPRSYYEQLMHINEQSPRVLRRQLSRYFSHVRIWCADHSCQNPADNLERAYSRAEIRAAGDLFAVASNNAICRDRLIGALRMNPLGEQDRLRVSLDVIAFPEIVTVAEDFQVLVRVSNCGSISLKTRQPYPVVLSYHWYDEDGNCLVFDGLRTAVGTFSPGCVQDIEMRVRAPLSNGMFRLRLTFVQESVAWFSDPPVSVFRDCVVLVR